MADTRRATTGGVTSRLGFAPEPPESKASALVCQAGRKPVSASGAPPKFSIDLPLTGSLGFSSLALQTGALTFASAGTIAVITAIIVLGIAIVVLLVIIRARGRANKRLVAKNHALGTDLRQSEQRVKESEAALKQVERKIAGLEKQILSLSAELASKGEEPAFDKRAKFVAIPADGKEAFSPVLDRERLYKITIAGTCGVLEQGFFGTKQPAGHADGFYRTDGRGAFSHYHEWLYVDGKSLVTIMREGAAKMCEQDREAHRYSFQIIGSGQKVGISLRPFERKLVGAEPSSLAVSFEALPEGTPSPAADERSNVLKTKLESLRLRAYRESHFLDRDFQQQYAQHNLKTILADLKQEWAREYDQFMHNAELKQLAQEQAPQVFDWLEARVKIVQLAERIMVAPAPPPDDGKKKDPTEEALARELRQDDIRADNEIARAKLKAQKILKAKAELESIPLDDEERERLETELAEDIFELGKEDEKNGTAL